MKLGRCHQTRRRPQVYDGGDGYRVDVNIQTSSRGGPTRGGPIFGPEIGISFI